MAGVLDKLFGGGKTRPDRINKAIEDAMEGKKAKDPTLGNPEGKKDKSAAAVDRMKEEQDRLVGNVRRRA